MVIFLLFRHLRIFPCNLHILLGFLLFFACSKFEISSAHGRCGQICGKGVETTKAPLGCLLFSSLFIRDEYNRVTNKHCSCFCSLHSSNLHPYSLLLNMRRMCFLFYSSLPSFRLRNPSIFFTHHQPPCVCIYNLDYTTEN